MGAAVGVKDTCRFCKAGTGANVGDSSLKEYVSSAMQGMASSGPSTGTAIEKDVVSMLDPEHRFMITDTDSRNST